MTSGKLPNAEKMNLQSMYDLWSNFVSLDEVLPLRENFSVYKLCLNEEPQFQQRHEKARDRGNCGIVKILQKVIILEDDFVFKENL